MFDKITLLNNATLDSASEKDALAIAKKFTKTGLKILAADFGFAWWKINGSYQLAYKSPKMPYSPNLPRKKGGNEQAQKKRLPFFVSIVNKKNYTPKYDVSPYMQSYVIIPIAYADKMYGNMVLCYKKKHIFTEEKKSLALALGNAAAQAITIHNLMQNQKQARLAAEQQQAHFRALIENSYDVIIQLNAEGKILYVSPSAVRISGYDPENLVGMNIYDLIHTNDFSKVQMHLQRILKNPNSLSTLEFRSRHKNGSWLWLESTAVNMLANPSVKSIVVNLRDINERKKGDDSMRQQALHDPLTTLYNRQAMFAHFDIALELAREKKNLLAVLFLDADNFKVVNDKYGHAIGDSVLKIIGNRLQSSIRSGDIVARFGGDEFVILLKKIVSAKEAEIVAKKILKKIVSRIKIKRHNIRVSVSIGIALYPRHGKNKELLIKRADDALYQAKEKGRKRYQVYQS
jgi:diguanylate cyclase (GGDEF)-like protein/PAS domain S-box-containing protein